METTMVNNRAEERVKAIARLMLLVFMIGMLFLGNVMEVSAAGERSRIDVETEESGWWGLAKPSIKIKNTSKTQNTFITVMNEDTWVNEYEFTLSKGKSTTLKLKPNAKYIIASTSCFGEARPVITATKSSRLNWW